MSCDLDLHEPQAHFACLPTPTPTHNISVNNTVGTSTAILQTVLAFLALIVAIIQLMHSFHQGRRAR